MPRKMEPSKQPTQPGRAGTSQVAVYAPTSIKFELKSASHELAVSMDAIVNALIAGFLKEYRHNPQKAAEKLKKLLAIEL